MIDPNDVARIARMDQLQMAFRTWAETLVLARDELMRVGIPQETAYKTAQDWIAIVIASCGAAQ